MKVILESTSSARTEVGRQVLEGFERVNNRLDRLDSHLSKIDTKLSELDLRFAEVDKRFVQVDAKIELLQKDLDAQPNKIIIRLALAVGAMLGLLFAALRYLPAAH